MSARREFIKKFGAGGLLLAAGEWVLPEIKSDLESQLERIAKLEWNEQITDAEFWQSVRQAYTVSPQIINLNNGGVSPQPRVVQEAVERYNRLSNETPSYYMWRILDQGREPLRRNMAGLAGCEAEELAFNRNASEALETVIFGLQLEKGDEVVVAKQDYPNMKHAWMQREARDGIVLKWVDLPLPMENDEEIVALYEKEFTEKTKVLHVTHLINWSGQVLPARKLADSAHERGIDVVIDGAHSFAHLDYKIPDLGGDYFGTSLHKWLCAPFGSGLLYVRKEKIAGLYPLFAAPKWDVSDIRKFEHLGTRSFAIEQAVGQALLFHEMIGSKRKADRLFYLKNYWAEKVKDIPGVTLRTSLQEGYSGALALIDIEGKSSQEIAGFLFKEYKIHVVGINLDHLQGVRITPNVYTLERELDTLVQAIRELASGN